MPAHRMTPEDVEKDLDNLTDHLIKGYYHDFTQQIPFKRLGEYYCSEKVV